MTLIVENDPTSAQTLRSALGPESPVLESLDGVERHVLAHGRVPIARGDAGRHRPMIGAGTARRR